MAALCLLAVAPAATAQTGQVTALRDGNRLFREGRIDEAYTAYLEGYEASAPHPVLSYNLGTTAHRLDRLPEAILWYRRAAAVNPGDPWLSDNLASARATLGLQPYPAPGLASAIARNTPALHYLAALVAWIGVAWWIARPRGRLRPTLILLALALTVYGVAVLADRSTPVGAVVTADCSGSSGDLPAGSEVWIARRGEETVEITAGGLRMQCPSETVSPVTSWR